MNTHYLDDDQNENKMRLNIDDDEMLEAGLRASFHRQHCPETMVLSEYQLGLAPASESSRLAAHLDRCPYCRAELSRLAEFLAEEIAVSMPTPATEVSPWKLGDGFEWRYVQEAGRVIIRLVGEALDTALSDRRRDSPAPADRLAFGGVRADQSDQSFQIALKEGVEDFEALIILDTDWRDPHHCAVTVEVNIPSRGGWPHLAGTEVTLKKDEATLAAHATNDFGRAVFKRIATAELFNLSFEITPQTNGD